ncbi:MAG: hypothetical protein UU46_C0012G0007 [Candidatus Uhrbacteria bacterium GW2011_GWD1_41_16]|uniref:Uncharacterized protein n=1 Tax=Candidatus Uhrbacteria bacterium GW2011_GWC1_41_20 TaxID=1618983 RepID=A0A0G0YF73_9BACT|nr:MAG: hypothetical protein UT52_C0018G0004 [Candidatus Uhrbacteria bacterium GW2011_GWE1_39_46]KKR63279.1 MAG: hypothetical protein UU04_C0021G0002 [Candidatus Uhrbacteria bacterium GW2011_GWC2_40_450]KKR95854.1 MAG: hypothetical protein UU46_C0012G0007 [Candidatus Uhrbacteria bacterium GW2011_GWD1_41_16]KKR98987.1 MAG: hypothetical protein UU50_C0012G0035 [Candidatus Uhrbacteria bacterium GW2011_GWC1_41_20]KKS07223.1 MAG: hypothetical protein UU62_C0020G0026 [Candidatus Uhrbacteria bacterium
MKSEHGFSLETTKDIEMLKTRFISICTKFGIDPDERIALAMFADMGFVLRSTTPGTKEWKQTKLYALRDMIRDADRGDEEYKDADDALRSWEENAPKN